jgi:hypothetical protein
LESKRIGAIIGAEDDAGSSLIMEETHLVYKLEGEIREIDVFKLAPTLLALGGLIQQSNRELFPEGQDVGVNVKPFREGSFIVDLTLFSPSHLQQIINFLTPHSIEQLNSLLQSIGLVGTGIGTTTMGALQAIKFLKGRPKSVEQVGPGEFRYTSHEDNSITVSAPVHTLLSNSSITQNIYKIYGQPMLDDPAVEDVKTYIQGEEQSAVTVTRDEVPAIREFVAPSSSPINPAETVKEILHQGVFLNPKRGAFGDDPKDWSFWRGDQVITATIKDKDFLAQTSSGEKRLNEADLLTVDLLERQRVKGTAVQKPTYEVIKVTDYKKGESQSS